MSEKNILILQSKYNIQICLHCYFLLSFLLLLYCFRIEITSINSTRLDKFGLSMKYNTTNKCVMHSAATIWIYFLLTCIPLGSMQQRNLFWSGKRRQYKKLVWSNSIWKAESQINHAHTKCHWKHFVRFVRFIHSAI